MNKIISWGLIFLVGLIPLFFLPFTVDFYEFNKNIFLIVSAFILLVLWLLKMALARKITFKKTPLDLPVLALAGAFVLSTIFASPNKWETLWTPLGTGTIVALTLLYFLITNSFTKDTPLYKSIIISASLLALLGGKLIGAKAWTPAGGLIPLATFLAVSLSLAITQIYPPSLELRRAGTNWKKGKLSISLYLYISISLLILAGLGITIWQLFTTAKPFLLSYSTSWAIAVESLKNWRLFLFGVGPTSFLDAFSQFRPLSYNLGNLWAVRFTTSGNYYLHLLTTVGILGLLSFGYLIWKIIKTRPISNIQYPIFSILVLFLFLPSNFLLLFVFYVMVALLTLTPEQKTSEVSLSTSEVKCHSWEYSEEGRILPWTIFIPTLLLVAGCFFFMGRAYAAEVYFKRSLDAVARNDGGGAYDNQIKAIRLNPFNDNYRIAYSQTNLALANSLASSPAGGDLSDQDRQNITVLVQQAIREAKTATTLNRNKIINWENLANIYRQLINFAQGADQWTIATMRQAINLDPVNPNLKLNLGGIYYALGEYDEAIVWFQKAVDNKVNFANGYYNLSAAYKEKGDFKKAHEMMQITLNLVPTNSEDYQKARNELEELAKKLPTETAGPSGIQPSEEIPTKESLMEPESLPSPVIVPPIELPEEQAAPL